MSETINILNANHIQANKLSAKCKAAYPIMLLPLRLEARFIHKEPSRSGTVINPNAYTLTALHTKHEVGPTMTTMEGIEGGIEELVNKSSHLPSIPSVEEVDALTAWKYAAISEAVALETEKWIPSYAAAIAAMEETHNAIGQLSESLSVRQNETAVLLSSTQQEELTIYTNQLLQTIANGDLIATTRGSHFINVAQHVLEQLRKFAEVLNQYSTVHPENYQTVENHLTAVKDVLADWGAEAQVHISTFYSKKDQLRIDLDQVNQQLEDSYNHLERESEYADQMEIWKHISGIHQRFPLYDKALTTYKHQELDSLLGTLEEYTTALVAKIPTVEEYSPYVHTHILTLQARYEYLSQQSTQHFEELAQTLSHYNGITNALIEEVGRALEQCATSEKSMVDYTPYFTQVNHLLEQLSRIPTKPQDWPAAQILLHTQFHQLTLDVLQADPLQDRDKQRLVDRWGESEELFFSWKEALGNQLEELHSKRESISSRLPTLQQELEILENDYLREQPHELSARAWAADYQLHLFLEAFKSAPTWKVQEQLDQLIALEGLLNNSNEQWNRIEGLNKASKFAIGENLGKVAAALHQVTTTRSMLQIQLNSHNQQLLEQKKYIEQLIDGIEVDKTAAAGAYEELEVALVYLRQHVHLITDNVAPTGQINLLLYDYWKLEHLLETVAFLVHPLEKLSPSNKGQLENLLNELLVGIDNRVDAVNNWLNLLQEQGVEVSQQVSTIENALDQQWDNYLNESEESALYQLRQKAATITYISALLQDPILGSLDNKVLLEKIQEPVESIATAELGAIEATPAYKELITNALYKAKEAASTAVNRQEEKKKRWKLHYQTVLNQYQELTTIREYLQPESIEGEGLDSAAQEALEQAIKATAYQLAQDILRASATTSIVTDATQQQFKKLLQLLKELDAESITIENKNALEVQLAIVETAFGDWKSNRADKIDVLTTQIEALSTQGEIIRIGGQGGQTNVAGLPGGGSFTTRYIDIGTICNLPIPVTGGTGGTGGTSGGEPTDPTELSNYELWVRAYPDDIAINNHEKRLLDEEIEDAIIYWTAVWNAAGKTKVEIGAWRVLVGRYGAERAAWLVKKMQPTNINKRPVATDISATVLEEIGMMSPDDVIKQGETFWRDIAITQNSPTEQKGVIASFKTDHPKGKAEVLSYLTEPEQLGQSIYKTLYNPATGNGVDEAGTFNLSATTAQITARSNQLASLSQVAALSAPVPLFPVLAVEDRRDNSWSMAAYTEVMPDQLVFLMYNWEGEVAHEVVGNLIPEKLQIGIDPNEEDQFDPSQADLGIKANTIGWMTNFEEAIAQGMAVKVPISKIEGGATIDGNTTAPGFSRMYVLGIKHYDREEETTQVSNIQQQGQEQIEELLNAHHYTDGGLAIIPPGTPTNNTSETTSEFSFLSDDVKDTYQTEIQYKLATTKNAERPADGHVLAEALGISSSVFEHIKNNRANSNHNAELINKALWMSTWGLYLEEMFGSESGFFQKTALLPNAPNGAQTHQALHYFNLPEDIDKVYQYFAPHVKGRGGLPSIRVGKQPYGILTTGVLQQNYNGWKWQDMPTVGTANELSRGFLEQFQKLLLKYLWGYKANNAVPPKWLRVVEEKIRTVDDPVTSTGLGALTGLQEQFMTILRLHPTAASYYARYALNPYSMLTHTQNGLGNATYEGIFRGSNVSLLNNWTQFNSVFQTEFGEFIDHYESGNNLTIPVSNTIISSLRLFDTYDNGNLETLQALNGAVVEETSVPSETKKLSPITGSTVNYIKWLSTTSPDDIVNRNKQPASTFDLGGEPSDTLLYTSLRNALINQYWDAAMRILEKENFRDYSLKHFNHNGQTGWGALIALGSLNNSPHPRIGSDTVSAEHYYVMGRVKANNGTVNNYVNYGYLRRDSYKAFIMDIKPHVLNNTNDPDKINYVPFTNYQYKMPYFGSDAILANGRLPFLMEVNTDDVPNITASNMTMAAYLFPGTGILPINALADYPEETAPLKAMLDALKVLAEQPVAELERLYAEHMDLASHRLDAWILGMANKRLHKIRENNQTGTYLGSYGWLMNLQPGGQRTAVNNSSILYNVDRNGTAPVMLDADNQGYIQAPSLNHAMTAAVLRSGYEAHKGTPDENLLAVNLSSERVRRATFYIEGIRNGQHLGALLGYRLERALKEANLAKYTLDLRQAYPIQQLNYQDNSQNTLAPTSPSSVIDGLAIVEKIREIETTPTLTFAGVFSYLAVGDRLGVEEAMQKIVQDMDALADLSLAEGTYQMVLGNYSRSNAMMNALSKGTPIPEPEIIKTPRTGQTLTHRVGMTLATINTATASPIWAANFTARALVEPALNAKLGELLPDPASVQCQVEYKHRDGTGAVTDEATNLSLASLQIEPIDLLYMFPDSVQDSHTELAKRFYQAAFNNATRSSNDAFYDFKLNFELNNVGGDYTIADIAPLMAQLQLLFSNSRYLRASDLVHPTADTTNLELTGVSSGSLQEMANRANALRNSLEQAANNLSAASNKDILWSMAQYGINEATLATPNEDNAAISLDYTNSSMLIKKLALSRVAEYDKVIAPISNDPELNTGDKVELYQKAVSKLLNKSFLMLPQVLPLNATTLQSAHGASSSILPASEPMAVERWTAGVARVRRQINRLENVSFLQGLFLDYNTESLQLNPVQLPYRPNDHWIGLELPSDYYKEHFSDTNLVSLDKLSLVMDWHAAPSNAPFVGLLIDEWTEKIPVSEETAGLAFHYDQPNAKAPQSILLAVHPENSDNSTAWRWDQLVNTLDTTLELSKIRAVEPDHLQTVTVPSTVYTHQIPEMNIFDAFSQLLPATFAQVAPPDSEENWSTDYHKSNNTHIYKTN